MNIIKWIKEYLFWFGRSPKKVRKEYEEELKRIDENRRWERIYKNWWLYCYAPTDYSKYQWSNQ